MTAEDLGKLEEVFRVVFDLPSDSHVRGVRRLTVRQWDSLAHVSLVAAIESEFGVTLDTTASERLTSFEAAKLLLDERLA